jgi:hypothetical protein
MPSNAGIRVHRVADRFNERNALYKVVIDGKKFGELWTGQSAVFYVGAGDHIVNVRNSFLGSNKVVIQLEDSEVIDLTCRPRGAIATMLNGLFRWNRFLDLHPMTPEERAEVDRRKAEGPAAPIPRNLGEQFNA